MSAAHVPGRPYRTTPLQELVAPAVRDEPGARDALLELIRPMVLHFCRSRLGPYETGPAAAEDVTQEVLIGVLHALPRYVPKGLPFRSYVLGIAANKIVDARRVRGRDRAVPVDPLPEWPVDGGGPEEHVLDAERADLLDRLVHRLPPAQREVLVLRLRVRLTTAETAQILGSTPGSVRVSLHRALIRLRRLLDEQRDGGATPA